MATWNKYDLGNVESGTQLVQTLAHDRMIDLSKLPASLADDPLTNPTVPKNGGSHKPQI